MMNLENFNRSETGVLEMHYNIVHSSWALHKTLFNPTLCDLYSITVPVAYLWPGLAILLQHGYGASFITAQA
jgi:hypothetical protein